MSDKERLTQVIKDLPFTKENFEFLKGELIKSTFPKSLSEKVEDAISGIDRNFQEDILNDWEKEMRLWIDETIEKKFPPYNKQ